MATEFDNSLHWGFFLTGTTLTSETGKYVRVSDLVLSALRAAGVFSNMVDGIVAPATDKLWLDKNFDPAVLKEWDATGASWVPMTYGRLFGRAAVDKLTVTGGTGNAVVVSQPVGFQADRLYLMTPSADNSAATTITVSGVGTYAAKYGDGSDLGSTEFTTGRQTVLFFTGSRFEVIFPLSELSSAVLAAQAAAEAAASSVKGFDPDGDATVARAQLSGPDYNPALADTYFSLVRGSTGTPDTRRAPVVGAKKISGASGSGLNPTAYYMAEKRTDDANTSATGVYGYAIDYAGSAGNTTFIEGIRGGAVLATGSVNGVATGGVFAVACSLGILYDTMVGVEGDVIQNSGVDAPFNESFSKSSFSAAFLATSNFGTNNPDVAFLVNPWQEANTAFMCGFFVPQDSVDATNGVAFSSDATAKVGMDLSRGTFSNGAIKIPNGASIRAMNGAGTLTLNIIYLTSGNKLVLGQEATGTQVNIDGTMTDLKPSREKLLAHRTYYVRTDGNDANTGLADTAGAAFLTIQKAATVAQGLDANGFTITIQVGDGTYTVGATFRGPVPGSTADPAVTIKGNSGTPGNVVINASSGYCFIAQWGARIRVQDMELRNSAAGACLYARGGTICFANIRFGTSTGGHIEANINGEIYNSGNYSIVGGAVSHIHAPASGNIAVTSATVTLTGTPAFSAYFAGAAAGVISITSVTYSGSATGTRYLSHKGGLIDTGGGGATFLPGNAAGSVATNGQYL